MFKYLKQSQSTDLKKNTTGQTIWKKITNKVINVEDSQHKSNVLKAETNLTSVLRSLHIVMLENLSESNEIGTNDPVALLNTTLLVRRVRITIKSLFSMIEYLLNNKLTTTKYHEISEATERWWNDKNLIWMYNKMARLLNNHSSPNSSEPNTSSNSLWNNLQDHLNAIKKEIRNRAITNQSSKSVIRCDMKSLQADTVGKLLDNSSSKNIITMKILQTTFISQELYAAINHDKLLYCDPHKKKQFEKLYDNISKCQQDLKEEYNASSSIYLEVEELLKEFINLRTQFYQLQQEVIKERIGRQFIVQSTALTLKDDWPDSLSGRRSTTAESILEKINNIIDSLHLKTNGIDEDGYDLALMLLKDKKLENNVLYLGFHDDVLHYKCIDPDGKYQENTITWQELHENGAANGLKPKNGQLLQEFEAIKTAILKATSKRGHNREGTYTEYIEKLCKYKQEVDQLMADEDATIRNAELIISTDKMQQIESRYDSLISEETELYEKLEYLLHNYRQEFGQDIDMDKETSVLTASKSPTQTYITAVKGRISSLQVAIHTVTEKASDQKTELANKLKRKIASLIIDINAKRQMLRYPGAFSEIIQQLRIDQENITYFTYSQLKERDSIIEKKKQLVNNEYVETKKLQKKNSFDITILRKKLSKLAIKYDQHTTLSSEVVRLNALHKINVAGNSLDDLEKINNRVGFARKQIKQKQKSLDKNMRDLLKKKRNLLRKEYNQDDVYKSILPKKRKEINDALDTCKRLFERNQYQEMKEHCEFLETLRIDVKNSVETSKINEKDRIKHNKKVRKFLLDFLGKEISKLKKERCGGGQKRRQLKNHLIALQSTSAKDGKNTRDITVKMLINEQRTYSSREGLPLLKSKYRETNSIADILCRRRYPSVTNLITRMFSKKPVYADGWSNLISAAKNNNLSSPSLSPNP